MILSPLTNFLVSFFIQNFKHYDDIYEICCEICNETFSRNFKHDKKRRIEEIYEQILYCFTEKLLTEDLMTEFEHNVIFKNNILKFSCVLTLNVVILGFSEKTTLSALKLLLFVIKIAKHKMKKESGNKKLQIGFKMGEFEKAKFMKKKANNEIKGEVIENLHDYIKKIILYFFSINLTPSSATLEFLELNLKNIHEVFDRKYDNIDFNCCFLNFLFNHVFCEKDEIRNFTKEFFFSLGEVFGKNLK